MIKWFFFVALAFLAFSIHEINAIPYQYSVDPLTLTWTTVTNAIAMDTDNNGYADQLYQYTSSPPNISFTKILGNGSNSASPIVFPNTGGGQHILSKINPDDNIIYVGGSYGSAGTSSSSLNSFNIITGVTSSNILNYNYTSNGGAYGTGYVTGYSGVSNEPVLVANWLPTLDGDYMFVKNSTQVLYASANDVFSTFLAQDSAMGGITVIGSDKLFIAGKTNDRVYQYTLTYPYELISAVYTNKNLNISAQSLNTNDIEMSSDGTKLYVLDDSDIVYQYNGTVAYDLSTFSYGSKSKNFAPITTVEGMTFKPDGTKMYIHYSGLVAEYSLSPAWNVATATATGNTLATTHADTMEWKPDGTRLWSTSGIAIRQYDCSTAWLLSSCAFTISYSNTGFSFKDISWTSDGLHLYSVNADTRIGEIQIISPYTVSGASSDLGSNFNGISQKSVFTDSDNFAKHYFFNGTVITNQPIGVTNAYDTGLCNANGCLVKVGSTAFTSMKPLTTFTSNGAVVDTNIQLTHAGMNIPKDIENRKTYWYEYLPTPDSSDNSVMSLLHYNILNPALTSDAYRFIFDNGTNKYIMYVTGTSIAYAPFDDTTLDNHSIGYYLPDTITDAMDTALTTAVIPVISFDIVTPTVRLTESFGGLFSLISGYQAETSSTVVRIIDSRMDNSTAIIPYTVGLSASQTQLTALIKNAPADSAVMVQDTTSKFLTEKYKWHIDYIKADKTFSVDLPYPKCVDIYIKDLTSLGNPWDFIGNICNTGTMPKTITYSANLAITFYSLPYGVAHTFDQTDNELTTRVRHDTLPYNYTVKIFDSNGIEQYNQEFTESVTTLDIQTINSTGISLPALLRVYDVDGNQLYYSTLGNAGYLSQTVAWFNEWLTIEGFNLLFMLPIVFGAMFTRNTVGIGTMSTVTLIATLSWFGVIPVPDVAIYLMIFVSIVGLIAYKKLYD